MLTRPNIDTARPAADVDDWDRFADRKAAHPGAYFRRFYAGAPHTFAFQDGGQADESTDEGGQADKSTAASTYQGDQADKSTAASTDQGGQGPDMSKLSTEALLDKLEREQAQRAKAQRELDEIRKREQEASDAKKTELEKVREQAEQQQKRAAELENKLRAEQVQRELLAQASEVGLRKPGLYLKLVDTASIEITDDGNVVGAREALEELKKADPSLFGAAQTTSNPQSGGGKQSDKSAAKSDEPETDADKGRAAVERAQNQTTDYIL